MITPQSATEQQITTSGIESAVDFSLDPTATAHILNMLRSGVYKDPKLACIREYWCNAKDSVVEAGKDPTKDVFITLPNVYDPYFKVRDEGLGMSEADVRRIFRKYGASTKRESNETIGCLGIGSKSAFSYSDTYTVTAIKSGMKRVFIASVARDSVGKDGIGSLNRVVEIETEEANGVEISIPVKEADFNEFYTKTSFFLSFLPENVRPIVKGINQSLITIPVRPSIQANDNWAITNERNSYAIMGGVPYNLDTTAMDGLSSQERSLVSLGVDIRFEIGALEPAISREEIRYTDFTQAALKTEFKKILDFLYEENKKKYAQAANIWAAKYSHYLLENMDRHSIHSKIVNQCLTSDQRSNLVWNGKTTVSSNLEIRKENAIDTVVYYCREGIGGVLNKSLIKTIAVKSPKIPTFVIHDASRYGEWQRCQGAINSLFANSLEEKGFYLIRFVTAKARDEFYADNEFATFQTHNLSKFSRDRSNSKIVTKTAARSFIFKYIAAASSEASWTPEVFDANTTGVYLCLKKFIGTSSYRDFNALTLQTHIVELEKIGVQIPKIYGFRPSVLDKIDKTKLIPFGDFFKNKVEEHLIATKTFQISEDQEAFNKASSGWNPGGYVAECVKNVHPLILTKDTLFEQYNDLYLAIKIRIEKSNSQTDLIQKYERIGGDIISVKQTKYGISQEVKDFIDMSITMKTQYPMLQFIGSSYILSRAGVIADYINLVHK